MLANSIANIAISDLSHSLQTPSVQLPFVETDTSAASKQEHVISVVSFKLPIYVGHIQFCILNFIGLGCSYTF